MFSCGVSNSGAGRDKPITTSNTACRKHDLKNYILNSTTITPNISCTIPQHELFSKTRQLPKHSANHPRISPKSFTTGFAPGLVLQGIPSPGSRSRTHSPGSIPLLGRDRSQKCTVPGGWPNIYIYMI